MSRFPHTAHDFEPLLRGARLGVLWALWMALGGIGAWGQFTDGLNVEFGKNRVQHRSFEWTYFEEGMFEVYHYREGDQIAGQVTRILSEEAKALAPMFGRSLVGPIQVLVFKSEAEFRQSNVGVMTSQDQETNIGGTAKLVGSKMFLYGRGDRLAMERDVREGCQKAPPATPDVAWTRGVQRASWMPPKRGHSNAWIKLQAPMRRFWDKPSGRTWQTSTACPPSPTSCT